MIVGTLLASLCLNVWFLLHREAPSENVTVMQVRDTIVEFRYSTDTIYNTKTKTEYKYITVNDTQYVEYKPETYHDSTDTYDIWIHSAGLEWYQLNIHARDTISDTVSVIQPVITKEKRFGVGINVGVGYGVLNKKPDLFIGVGAYYKF